MPQEKATGPAALLLTAAAARRYYFDGASKSEIAAELDVSRFKVARLLEQARASGLVRIEFDYHGDLDLDLSQRLRDAHQLRHCVVVDCPDDDEVLLRAAHGSAAAALLAEIVDADDTLGLVWARTLLAMRTSLTQLAPCTVVQLTGSLSRPEDNQSSVELVRDVAAISGGPAYLFYIRWGPALDVDGSLGDALHCGIGHQRVAGLQGAGYNGHEGLRVLLDGWMVLRQPGASGDGHGRLFQ